LVSIKNFSHKFTCRASKLLSKSFQAPSQDKIWTEVILSPQGNT
jgi:hypothetical protein